MGTIIRPDKVGREESVKWQERNGVCVQSWVGGKLELN